MRKMTEDEAWDFLRAGDRTAVFASVRSSGRPHAVPTWYAVDGDEIVLPNQTVERLDERRPNGTRRHHLDVRHIEEQHEHARTRVERRLPRFSHGVGFAPRVLGTGAADDDVLELFDSLRNLVLENLEIRACEVGDRLTVACRVCVHADVICTRAERWTRGLILSA